MKALIFEDVMQHSVDMTASQSSLWAQGKPHRVIQFSCDITFIWDSWFFIDILFERILTYEFHCVAFGYMTFLYMTFFIWPSDEKNSTGKSYSYTILIHVAMWWMLVDWTCLVLAFNPPPNRPTRPTRRCHYGGLTRWEYLSKSPHVFHTGLLDETWRIASSIPISLDAVRSDSSPMMCCLI